MTSLLGLGCLGAGCIISVASAMAMFLPRLRSTARGRAILESLILLQGACAIVAFACLTYAFLVSDFSVAAVALYSQTDIPLYYKIAGVWANHEGSMLLWLMIMALYGLALVLVRPTKTPPFYGLALCIQGALCAGFFLFVTIFSNPLLPLANPPIDGHGLNPLLQDPALAYHPPLLYLGYVGFCIPFAVTVAALWHRSTTSVWANFIRPWCLFAWVFLTAGIALGSLWAYYELGWGGWWFWDPVENAALMPWLTGTTLIHGLKSVQQSESFKRTTVLLALLTFGLSLLGAFIVRSGFFSSVHSFAYDPTRGFILLAFWGVYGGGALLLYLSRLDSMRSPASIPFSREQSLSIQAVCFLCLTVIVFWGTFYPLLVETLSGNKTSVGVPYYGHTFVPLALLTLCLMPFGPLLAWHKTSLHTAFQHLMLAMSLSLGLMVILLYHYKGGPLLAIPALGCALWCGVGALVDGWHNLRHYRASSLTGWGRICAHFGVALAIGAMAVETRDQQTFLHFFKMGERARAGSYSLELKKVEEHQGSNYRAERVTLVIYKDGKRITTLTPERRYHPRTQLLTTKTDLAMGWWEDLYGVVSNYDPEHGWGIRLQIHPFMRWLWMGAALIVLGGILSLVEGRCRRRPEFSHQYPADSIQNKLIGRS